MFGSCEISAPVQSAPFDTVAILAGQPAQGDIHRLLATRKSQGQGAAQVLKFDSKKPRQWCRVQELWQHDFRSELKTALIRGVQPSLDEDRLVAMVLLTWEGVTSSSRAARVIERARTTDKNVARSEIRRSLRLSRVRRSLTTRNLAGLGGAAKPEGSASSCA